MVKQNHDVIYSMYFSSFLKIHAEQKTENIAANKIQMTIFSQRLSILIDLSKIQKGHRKQYINYHLCLKTLGWYGFCVDRKKDKGYSINKL